MLPQFGKPPDDEQFLPRRSRIDLLVLQDPGVAVRHKNRVQTGRHRGIDIRLRTVADHPRGIERQLMFFDHAPVCSWIFLGDNLDRGKIFLQAGALDLSRLLGDRSLGHQDQPMALRQVLQRLQHFRQQLHRMIGDAMRKAIDLRVQLRRHRLRAQTFKRSDQRMRKAVQSVPVFHNALALHVVEHSAHLLGRKLVVIQKRDEARDRPLEINIVLPQRIVGVDEKGLGRQAFGS
jgi:hypothetical protein